MKNLTGEKIYDEDLLVIYPRRIIKKKNYEVWQFPYVKNNIYHDDFNLAVVRFGFISNDILLISEHQNRLEDREYIGRVQLLVHDISSEFNVDVLLVKNIFSNKVQKIIKEFGKKRMT